jgi:hypothetical protein
VIISLSVVCGLLLIGIIVATVLLIQQKKKAEQRGVVYGKATNASEDISG